MMAQRRPHREGRHDAIRANLVATSGPSPTESSVGGMSIMPVASIKGVWSVGQGAGPLTACNGPRSQAPGLEGPVS
jgi:hypothetical protein